MDKDDQHSIVLTGSTGTVGSYLLQHSLSSYPIIKLSYKSCYKSIEESLFPNKNIIKYLIHCAAPLDLDKGEIKRDEHRRDILSVTKNICDFCAENKIVLIYMSSTGVYGDWKTTPYCEEDVCRPTSFHHKCKLEAENYIQKNLNQYFILRLGWIFSSKFSNSNHDFISKIQSLLRKSEELITNDIQKGVPTPTSLVDEVIEHVINLEEIDSDIINVVSSGSASRTEYIKEVQNVFGTEVDITGSNTFERTAKVSNNETATNEKLSNFLNNEIHTWQSYLKRIEK